MIGEDYIHRCGETVMFSGRPIDFSMVEVHMVLPSLFFSRSMKRFVEVDWFFSKASFELLIKQKQNDDMSWKDDGTH